MFSELTDEELKQLTDTIYRARERVYRVNWPIGSKVVFRRLGADMINLMAELHGERASREWR